MNIFIDFKTEILIFSRWTRREETDFYRVVSTYGIEFDRHKGRYIWDKFRVMARLDKKTDEQLTEYFISFYHMCLRVCRKIKEEGRDLTVR